MGCGIGSGVSGRISSVEEMSSRPKEEHGGMDMAADRTELTASNGRTQARGLLGEQGGWFRVFGALEL